MDNLGNTSSAVAEEAAECRNYNGISIAVLIYSIVVLVLYALLQRRVDKYKEIIHGFLGIPVPVNLIYETKDRWAYALAFGALTVQLIRIILDDSIVAGTNAAGNIWRGILLVLIMMIFPLTYFALFASIHGMIQIVSHIIGFVYVLLLFIQLILRCTSCDDAIDDTYSPGIERNTERAVLYSQCITTGICHVLLGAFFVWRGAQATVYLIMGKPFPPQHTIDHHIGHVKRIFNKPPPSVPSNKLFAILQHYLYQWDPYFKFSVRVISAGVVIVLALFLLTFQLVNLLVLLVNFLEEDVFYNLGFDEDFANAIVGLSYFFGIVVPFVSYVLAVIGYFTSLVTYRRQCRLLWKGDRSFLPAKKKPTARILLSSIHFFGFQVGMAIWAWILYSIILTIIMFAVLIFIISMVLFDFIRDWILERFVLLITSLVTGYIIYYAQLYFIKYAFVSKEDRQKKPSNNTKSTTHGGETQTATQGEIILVDNRRLFHLFTFFFLFYYMLIGLFKAIRRVIVSAALNVFYFTRVDTPLTVRGWEFLDKAYASYAAILKVDATYNNPVMNVFIYLMSNVNETRREPHSSIVLSVIEKITVTKYYNPSLNVPLVVEQNSNVTTSRAKKRWYLAYTLVQNPDLIKLRRRDHPEKNSDKDPTTYTGHSNPGYIDDGHESGIRIEKDDSTKL